jgi:hypothetical protein
LATCFCAFLAQFGSVAIFSSRISSAVFAILFALSYAIAFLLPGPASLTHGDCDCLLLRSAAMD